MKHHDKQPAKRLGFKIDEIFLIVIVAIVAVGVASYEKSKGVPPIEAEKITAMLLNEHGFSILNKGVVDEKKLNELKTMDYGQLKQELNVKKDFCIYMEDDAGRIILAKSSEKLFKDGSACKR